MYAPCAAAQREPSHGATADRNGSECAAAEGKEQSDRAAAQRDQAQCAASDGEESDAQPAERHSADGDVADGDNASCHARFAGAPVSAAGDVKERQAPERFLGTIFVTPAHRWPVRGSGLRRAGNRFDVALDLACLLVSQLGFLFQRA